MFNELTITVGIPGCGKSTWADEKGHLMAIMRNRLVIISSDDIREELLGDVNNQEQNRDVFKVVNDRVVDGITKGYEVLVDATNLRPKFRRQFLEIANAHEVVAFAARFAISENFDECQRRNLGRERQVPEDVMRRFHQTFLDNCSSDQLLDEGWIVYDVEEPCESTDPPTAGCSTS